jgi:hypothetical protein
MTGDRSYFELRDSFMELVKASPSASVTSYTSPELYSENRVTYIIPPVTDIEQRDEWNPGDIYVVNGGTVVIGRVFYTRTSGEYLIEELVLKEGDIFGEFEVPLTILGHPHEMMGTFPPRFSMTYGAWASGPALNWAMSYPRDIARDSVVPENAKVAVHPFYIKSKNIRPVTGADVITLPAVEFEHIVSTHPEAMTWFLMNVLRKTRLYFEPPSQGYGRSPVDIVGRLIIRLLAYRIRLGIAVFSEENGRKTCSTFLGPTEWLKFGLSTFMTDMKEVIHELGAKTREALVLPVFNDELADIVEITAHYPVKDLDDEILEAMGCLPEEDRKENRYGLLTGIKVTCRDIAAFNDYLITKGE